MRLRVIDLETSGNHPGSSEVIEFGSVDLISSKEGWQIERLTLNFFCPMPR
ncbi:hypothetical protein [Asaia astilbis]|uniref:hypothetical protein n=1 Tax=Asaia astilbis TaxID=610244 RepID=UPI000A574D0B|nr:hypothetical protein [Asaia astilbis]